MLQTGIVYMLYEIKQNAKGQKSELRSSIKRFLNKKGPKWNSQDKQAQSHNLLKKDPKPVGFK